MFNIDIQYTWLLLFLPLVVAAFDWFLLTKRPDVAALTSTFSCLATFVLSLGLLDRTGSDSFSWLPISDIFSVDLGFVLDPLSTRMMLVVTGIGLLVHVFSLAYMADDKAKTRYFACLSLFMFSMTGIVLANNIAMTFIFWELVGLSSYLLIGHWYTRDTAANAAKKAFICNRVGDFGFLIGILTLWALTNTLDFSLMEIPAGISENLLNITVLCLFCGAVGKSAQFPLHVWLPDAMEGPTPVSALIHAATMVTAGVFMLARCNALFALSSTALAVITVVGAVTTLFAATIALTQTDIKRVVAYSTISQLAYMFIACGVGAYGAGVFHLFTHAFFKALLFLAAGSVIMAMHHNQDMRYMGGLRKYMPITHWTSLAGTLALIGVPFFSGFYSKDGIILALHASDQPMAPLAFWAALLSVITTAFYSMRMYFLVFWGRERYHENPDAHHHAGHHAHHGDALNVVFPEDFCQLFAVIYIVKLRTADNCNFTTHKFIMHICVSVSRAVCRNKQLCIVKIRRINRHKLNLTRPLTEL